MLTEEIHIKYNLEAVTHANFNQRFCVMNLGIQFERFNFIECKLFFIISFFCKKTVK